MSTGYKISEQDELQYVTFQIVRWIDIFTRRVYRDIVTESLRFCQYTRKSRACGNCRKSRRLSVFERKKLCRIGWSAGGHS